MIHRLIWMEVDGMPTHWRGEYISENVVIHQYFLRSVMSTKEGEWLVWEAYYGDRNLGLAPTGKENAIEFCEKHFIKRLERIKKMRERRSA